MNCTDFKQHLDDYLSNELDERQTAAFLGHAGHCIYCRGELDAAREIGHALRSSDIPPASQGFANRVLRQAKTSPVGSDGKKHQRRGFATGFGSALVAGLALWVVVGLFPGLQETPSPNNPMAGVSIALDQTSQVNLVFQTAQALQNAKIAIELPPHVALVGFPGQRQVEWRTDLIKGKNLLRLPVIASQAGGNQPLIAHIEYGNKKMTTLQINLAVVKQDISQQWSLDRKHT